MFTELTAESYQGAIGQGLQVVLFYKEKCPFCSAMKKILAKFAEGKGAGRDVAYFQINRDEHPSVAEALEVDRIPTIVFYSEGEISGRKTGSVTYLELDKLTK